MWTARVHKYRQVLNYRKNDDNPPPLVALLANTGFLFKKAGNLPDGIISVIKISYKFIKSWAMMHDFRQIKRQSLVDDGYFELKEILKFNC